MKDRLESLMLDYELAYNSFVFDRGRLADYLIAHGVTFATDNNVRSKGLVDLATIKKAIKPKADSTLNNMKKADLIDYIRCLENNYNTAVWFNENQARYVESLKLPKWIPVSERLPNDGEDVLLYDKNFGLIDIGTYFKVGSRGSRNQTPRFVIMGSKHPIDDYTHWMPLPESPEGDSSQ